MIIRLGYVAIALKLPKVTSSSTVTYTNYEKLNTEEKRLDKLKLVTNSNLNDLFSILQYNKENNIHFYRITSALIPLATHPEVNFDYRKFFKADFLKIGKFVKEQNMRVDTHPDQFNVLNSTKEEVVMNTERNLWPHVHLFEDMDYPLGKMVLHIGSSQEGKEASIKRFIQNYKKFPHEIQQRLILENDDKTFNVEEVLSICKELEIPFVLDVHHHLCNNDGSPLESYLQDFFNTWDKEPLPPKIHFSSPKEGGKDRKHDDFIVPEDFINFIEICRPYNRDFDVMIEAKQKDLALYKLVNDIRSLRNSWKWIDETTIEI